MQTTTNGATKWRAPDMDWKRPRDGKGFVGFLAGSRRDTREEFARIFWERYGIKIATHIGHEHRKEVSSLFIRSDTEVVIIIADDIYDPQMQRVLHCLKAMPNTAHLAIEYSKRKNPAAWDPVFIGNGFSSPPKWRDGVLLENKADHKKLEEQRLAELAAIEETRTAYVDPALKGAPKLGEIIDKKLVEATLNQYKPAAPKAAPEPVKRGRKPGTAGKIGERSANAGSTPWAAELIEHRTKLGISQGEACRRINIKQGMLSSYERGQTVPLYGVYLKILKLYPNLSEPPDMAGKAAFLARGGTLAHRDGTEEKVITPGQPITAAQAFGGGKKAKEKPHVPVAEPAVVAPVAVVAAPALPASPLPTAPAVAPVAAPTATAQSSEDLRTITLRQGGTVTLTASVSLFKLKGEDRAFVFALMDLLNDYEEKVEKEKGEEKKA